MKNALHNSTELYTKTRVPRIFHFIFGLQAKPQPLHLIHYLCLESCFQVNQPEKIYFYCHREPTGRYWDIIKNRLEVVHVNLVPQVLAYDYKNKFLKNNYLYAHHSDFIRLEKLNEMGGIYADIDTLFVNSLPPNLFSKSFVMGREPDVRCEATGNSRPSVCNAFIMAEKSSQFGLQYYSAMANALNGSWSNHSCFLAADLSQKYPDLIHIEPQNSFFKHSWTREGIQTLLTGQDLNTQGVYSMHLWAHLWWSKKRKDFSNFHAGLMTESFVRSVDTTYTVIARQFLPIPKRSRYIALGEYFRKGISLRQNT